MKGEPKSIDRGKVKRSDHEYAQAGMFYRSRTTPITASELGEQDDGKAFESAFDSSRLQKQSKVPKVDDRMNKSNPELTGGASDLKAMNNSFTGVANTTRERPSMDGNSEETKVGSETTDWATVRRKTEGFENSTRPNDICA